MNRVPHKPTRSCRNKTGPEETTRMSSAINIIRGSNTGEASITKVMSNTLFQRGDLIIELLVGANSCAMLMLFCEPSMCKKLLSESCFSKPVEGT